MNQSVAEAIRLYGVIPVLVIENEKDALPLANALYEGTLPVAEVTFRTSAAMSAISQMVIKYPDMLVGAGTVINIDQVNQSLAAGAKYIITPSYNPRVVDYCVDNDVFIIPNCTNNYEIEQAMEHGLRCIKFFPANNLGGVSHLKAINSIYSNKLKFIPTGGINEENCVSYFEYDKVLAVGGSWIAKADAISEGRFIEISQNARAAVLAAVGFSLSHFGINSKNEGDAVKAAKFMQKLFGLQINELPHALYSGSHIEIIKAGMRGTKGHIGFKVRNIDRAMAFLTREGIALDTESAIYDKEGRIQLVYLKDELLGFAIHICL